MALTRIEELLNAIAGNGNPPAYPNWPVTSDEEYLYAILNSSSDVPTPLTRKQQYLDRRAAGGNPFSPPEPKAESETLVCPVCCKEYTSQTWFDKHLLTHEEVNDG